MHDRQIAIRVDGLGKRYRLGRRERYLTLRDRLASMARAPWRARVGAPGTVWALRDVTFELERGRVLGVIGRNGAGKSTLLKILARITEPTTGCAEIRGRIGSLLEVGTGFHPELTGRENIFLSGAILGMSKAEIVRKFDEIVDFAGVEPFIDTPVKQYSSGMHVRLGFAVAAHLEVEILVVDEALAVGDVTFQRKCLGRMAGAANEGRTVLFVSHDLAAIGSLTDRAICLDEGRMVAAGATPDVIGEYLARAARPDVEGGYASLSGRSRPEAIVNSDAVRLDWARTADRAGAQRGAFDEGDPILVEFGFTVVRPAERLEFVSGVASVEQGVVLFIVTSPKYEGPIAPGAYALELRIDPNFLRAGAYSLGFKVFADGRRADTLHDALRFEVVDAAAAGGPVGEYRRWDGHMRFDYAWSPIARRADGSGAAAAPVATPGREDYVLT